MIMDIVIYPDSKLRKTSLEVVEFGSYVSEKLDMMYEIMLDKNGVGIAAVQVGILERMFIVNIPREDKIQYKEDLIEIINPRVLESSGEIIFQEGCLSIPGYYEDVVRANNIKIEFFDREGRKRVLEVCGYLSVAIQHEIDHLDGLLFIDRLPLLKRRKFDKEYKKILKNKK